MEIDQFGRETTVCVPLVLHYIAPLRKRRRRRPPPFLRTLSECIQANGLLALLPIPLLSPFFGPSGGGFSLLPLATDFSLRASGVGKGRRRQLPEGIKQLGHREREREKGEGRKTLLLPCHGFLLLLPCLRA